VPLAVLAERPQAFFPTVGVSLVADLRAVIRPIGTDNWA